MQAQQHCNPNMQVQPLQHSGLYHAHPPAQQHQHQQHAQDHIHANGTHSSDSSHHYSPATTTNGHFDMNPYQQAPYAGAHGAPQQQQQQAQQQRQYSANQLPPMYPSMSSSMGAPPPPPSLHSGMSGHLPSMYLPSSSGQLPPPSAHGMQAPQERQLSFSGENGRYKFTLSIEQQPQRARMCGFGDKDRRPITPPPCVRLIITDLQTGLPANMEQIEGTFFVLQVDLWDETAQREVNIVKSSSTSPAVSISTATMTSYPPTADRSMMEPPVMVYQTPEGKAIMAPPPGYMGGPSYVSAGGQYGYMGGPSNALYPGAQPGPGQYMGGPSPSGTGSMFTRNLIGSLTVNASWLKDPDNKYGFWFVLQDLSVRTEGFFRLKMNFIDVGAGSGQVLNRGKAPVLAWAFSDKFQVYSAKKFPGVIESTPLSKCFAGQGIKIPIRKDAKDGKGDRDDGDDE